MCSANMGEVNLGLEEAGGNDVMNVEPRVKKRKTWREENRYFQQKWEMKFLMFLKIGTSSSEQVAVCAVCKKEIHQIKTYAMHRHYSTHANVVAEKYKNDFQRHMLLNRAKNELDKKTKRQMQNVLNEEDQINLTCFKVALCLAQSMKPLSDGEVVKNIVLAVQSYNPFFSIAPLSSDTIQERIRDMANFIQDETVEKIALSPFYSLSLDESRDVTGKIQVIVGIRYFDCDSESFCERVLCLATLPEHANRENIFQTVRDRIEECHIGVSSMCGLTANGTAVLQNGSASLLDYFQQSCAQKLFLFSCFSHQVLVNRASMKTMNDIESVVKKVIYVINTGCVDKWRFSALWESQDESQNVLLNYNAVHWISFNDNVQRLFEIWEDLIQVLTAVSPELAQQLQDPFVHGCLLFLKEFLPKVSAFNLKLQKSELTIIDSMELINTFKMMITHTALNLSDFTVYNELGLFLKGQDAKLRKRVCLTVLEYLKILSEDLKERFGETDFFSQYGSFVTDPFSSKISTFLLLERLVSALQDRLSSFEALNFAGLKYLMQKLQKDKKMKAHFSQQAVTVEKFWSSMYQVSEYKHLGKFALLFLTLFPTTVLCERAFSALHFFRCQDRDRLTESNLQALLLVSQETRQPEDFPFYDLQNFCKHRQLPV
ncbi:SCAN domain-containing protein 3 isoform X4 [Acipenser ruthenus]|uniref:SCAN domain-containing protein 3 isoform X4 n=1 Tax=Acipenser ruthenus TaxID=7906 RepID=UPI002740FC5C|nr:SCAN domain-containing protein 3 isoform X4 [Acipenser ruthenus]